MNIDSRMKRYESIETSKRLIPLLPVYIRLDGRCFSKFTESMDKPYDVRMNRAMIETTKYLVHEINACIGYTQSDEINLVVDNDDPDAFLGNKIFKLVSLLAGMASSQFLLNYIKHFDVDPVSIKISPCFDCRVINLPSKTETANMILWRVQDATKNAITSACRTLFSDKEILYKNSSEKQDMLFERGINFNEYPEHFKRGTFVKKVAVEKEIEQKVWDKIPEWHRPSSRKVRRKEVQVFSMPIFSKVTNREDVIFEGSNPATIG